MKCKKPCNECPFMKTSAKGWLGEHEAGDFIEFMNAEVSFPCHLKNDGGLSFDEIEQKIDEGEMVLCSGYVQFMKKACKLPFRNQQLVEALKGVEVVDGIMTMPEFIKHHTEAWERAL